MCAGTLLTYSFFSNLLENYHQSDTAEK